MKNITFYIVLFLCSFSFAQQQTVTYSVSPTPFEATDMITLTFNGNSINEATWGVTGNALYLWSWSFDTNNTNLMDCPTNGTWAASSEANRLTYNAGPDTYTISFVPTTFYNRASIGRIGFLIKAKDGDGNKKSQDILVNVGSFQVTLTTPLQNSTTVLSSGGSMNVVANNSGGNASYILKASGTTLNTNASTSSYSYTHTNITTNQNYLLEVTQSGTTVTKKFAVLVNPGTVTQALPAGMVDGINYTSSTSATLVLNAPLKDFVYVAGSFNNWQPNVSHAMKKDGASGKFWLEITGLTAGQTNTYQYWVVKQTPAVANTPVLVKTADPFSTLVLSPFDDPGISAASYPNLPAYPAGQEREVTVLKTGETPYNWQVTNFTKPKKEDLVVYEVLIRDFDANRNYQSLINRIDYFKNLNVNAIQLMPVMEYEGNESWGYNTAFHMALDKYYGTENKLKEFIDLCHQNGIAVILDIALNHAFGRNPMVRMWMNDPDGDGWGGPSSESPYFNQTATHSYSVGEDFNHIDKPLTQNYVKRVVKHWIEDFKIDGFRWDLTKGFTQNCTGSESCTNSYQQDRVDILTDYANYSWTLDPEHYVIFEHLGPENEEKVWANLKYNEGKGVMMWGKMTEPYNQLTMGFNSNNNIAGVGHKSRSQFQGPRVIGYAESHDEERLMYKNVTFGNNSNSTHNVRNLNTALSRMSALGAATILVPGPKMIWHFGELGMENSIFTCNNGSVNLPGGTDGDCKLDTKPQSQWTSNWLGDANRSKIYNDWARMIQLKKEEPVFEGDYDINSGTLTPKINIENNALLSTDLKNVVILTNFDVTTQNIVPNFPYTGVWYDLMDPTGTTTITVNNTGTAIPILPGQFRVYGNKASTLSIEDVELGSQFKIYPNPVNNAFYVNTSVEDLKIFDLTGKLVKSFKGDFTEAEAFDISDLKQSIYLVKIENSNGQILNSKLIKL